MLIVDAHEDLAWNVLTFGRDYTRSVAQIRQREQGTPAPQLNGDSLLGWEEYQRGGVAVVFATLFASPLRLRHGDWDVLVYADADQARRVYRQQLDVYLRMEADDTSRFRVLRTRGDLRANIQAWEAALHHGEDLSLEVGEMHQRPPVGLVLLMEGAEAIGHVAELEDWWQWGVRIIGPAWVGTRFCGGTHEPGPMTAEGFALLEAMAALGFGLDLSHMDEKAALQALDFYPGVVLASHSNAKALLRGDSGNRHLSDTLIRALIERQGVIGIVPFNAFLQAGWKRGDPKEAVSLHHVLAQIDYICQLAGNALHVGIGSDFDGGFGVQSTPVEVDSIADVRKLAPLLVEKGYNMEDVTRIMGSNWLRLLDSILPEAI